MSGADASTGPMAENRTLLIAAVAGALVLLVLLGLLGFGGAVGFIGFVVYGVVWLVVGLFVLWMLYRFVVAVERIADAQQRTATARNPPSGAQATTATPAEDAGGEPNVADTDDGDGQADDAGDDT